MTKTWQRLKTKPALYQRYLVREAIYKAIRLFFAEHAYHEVEVPLLTSALIPESYLEIFETNLLDRNRKPQKAYFTPSPEIFLKKLLVAGIGNCYALTKSFRNTESNSNTHNPEFSMLEWYHIEADYKDVMDDTEELFCFIVKFLSSYYSNLPSGRASRIRDKSRTSQDDKNPILTYQGKSIDLTPPWERLTMVEAFQKYANIDLLTLMEDIPMRAFAKSRGYHVESQNTWEQLFNQIYLNEVESQFGRGKPTIVYEFPAPMAALAKKKPTDPRFAERFEVFIEGLELGDAYTELADWKEQEERFKAETLERARLGKIDHPYDRDFIEALKAGLPRCSGMAMGLDRLVMLFANAKRIQDVLFFPAEEMWPI